MLNLFRYLAFGSNEYAPISSGQYEV